MGTLAAFLEAEGITATAEPASHNPNAAPGSFEGAAHWSVTLKRGGETMVVPFSMGSAHRTWRRNWQAIRDPQGRKILHDRYGTQPKGGAPVPMMLGGLHPDLLPLTEPVPPDAAGVLDCLASDCASVENVRSFEEWAEEFGYDTDSRRALETYRACERLNAALARFLGGSAYGVLLWETERD